MTNKELEQEIIQLRERLAVLENRIHYIENPQSRTFPSVDPQWWRTPIITPYIVT
jgi:hypothetical protein